MNTPQIFNFEQHEVRTVTIHDEPFFVGKDVAKVLGYQNGSRDINRHVDVEDRQNYQNGTFESPRGLTIINESGLYSLILGSKQPNAKKFKRWVTSEVLPAIRKHGGYLTPEKVEEALLNPDTIIQLATKLKEERTGRLIAEQKIAEYEPKISYLDSILSSTDSVTISQIAADYGMSPQQIGMATVFLTNFIRCRTSFRMLFRLSLTMSLLGCDDLRQELTVKVRLPR